MKFWATIGQLIISAFQFKCRETLDITGFVKKSGAPFLGLLSWERRNRTKSLWGNVSLLRGCLRHLSTPICIECPERANLYVGLFFLPILFAIAAIQFEKQAECASYHWDPSSCAWSNVHHRA